jgi:hypothetical protein
VRRSILVSAGLLIIASANGTSMAIAQTQCKLQAWSTQRDPAGLNVRDQPGKAGRVIGTLPPDLPDASAAVGFDVIGSSDGWLKIKNAVDLAGPSAKDKGAKVKLPRKIYSGEGWVHGSKVRVAVQTAKGYAAPGGKGEPSIDFGENWATEYARVSAVLACDGAWSQIELRAMDGEDGAKARQVLGGKGTVRAWFSNICGMRETTCDSKSKPGS